MNTYTVTVQGKTFTTTTKRTYCFAYGQIIDGQPMAPGFTKSAKTAKTAVDQISTYGPNVQPYLITL